MQLDELLGDAEPEAGAAVFAADGGVCLAKLREDVVKLVLGDPDPCRSHGRRGVIEPLGRDLDPPLFRELDRVPGQIHEALGDTFVPCRTHGKI
jgi:hypothetical protein